MNPYAPPQPEKPFVCEKCKAIDEKPGPISQFFGIAFLLLFMGLATHGLMTIAKQQGIVDKNGQHFWFEAELRKAIHGR